MRINKFLSEAGHCSRREADRLVSAGKVTINDKKAVLGDTVQDSDIVKVEGKQLKVLEDKIYIAFNKPVGVITTSDMRSRNNIMDAIKRSKVKLPDVRIFPVGRLDVASSGLILFTNDNDLANILMRPEGGHEKEYEVVVNKEISDKDLAKFRKRMRLGKGIVTLPSRTKRLGPRSFSITITEGKNRQVRRMCEALGFVVDYLERVRISKLKLGTLKAGEWRFLTEKEAADLKA